MGLAFNLLRLIETSLQPIRDKYYLNNLFQAIHARAHSENHAPLFLVLNYFLEPSYSPKRPASVLSRNLLPPASNLSKHLTAFYSAKTPKEVESLFLNFKPSRVGEAVLLSDAMKFQPFDCLNQVYNLNFLGNLYLGLQLS